MDKTPRRFWCIMLAAIILAAAGCDRQPEDTTENRLEAARRYQQVSPMKDTMKEAIEDLSKRLPPPQQDDFIEFMNSKIDAEAIEQKAVESMAKHYSVQEIKALTDFYGSQEGKAIMKKYGDYMAEVMPVIQTQLGQAAQAWQQKNMQQSQPQGEAQDQQQSQPEEQLQDQAEDKTEGQAQEVQPQDQQQSPPDQQSSSPPDASPPESK